jgi:membrane fusion protein (multidrug efflux system)
LDQSVSPTVARTATTPSVGIREDRQSVSRGRGSFLLRPRFLAAAAVVLLALAYGGREIYLRFTHVYEYDARVTADIVTVSSRADGWLVDMPVREGMRVEAGQVIARIDDRVSKLRADGLKAQIGAIQAEREKLQAERRIAEVQADTMIYTRGSAITARKKALAAVDADLALAKTELERNRALFERKVVNERQMQVAEAAAAKLESQRAQAVAEYEEAEGRLLEARAERDKLGAIDAQTAALEHRIANLEAQLAQQRVDVEDRTIRSPVPAVIDRTFMLPGEYVAAGQRILLLHNPKEVWVEANIKETQVGRLKLGQPVVVAVDAYPSDRFMGRVARIGSATTARFALIPTPNPSGNFTKITQRVPVKIDMVEMPKPLSPGMMVEVEIDLR